MPELYPVTTNAYTFVPDAGENVTNVTKGHGPYYFFNPGLGIHRIDQRDSVPHIYPCTFTSCIDAREWHLADSLMEGRMTVVATQRRKDPAGNIEEWASILKPASDIYESILETFGEWGVVEIEAFRNRAASELQLDILNSLIYPVTIEPSSILDEFLQKQVNEKGGLAVRQDFFSKGLAQVRAPEFGSQFGIELQKLYLLALEQSISSFHRARNYFMGQLTESDSQVSLGSNGNADGKALYDEKDRYLQWLLARRPAAEMLTQIAGRDQQPIIVNVPQQSSGITKEDLAEILKTVLAATQPVQVIEEVADAPTKERKPRIPSIIKAN